MAQFDFSNEEIVYTYFHFKEYLDVITNRLLRELKMTQGQLKTMKEVYGDDETFDTEGFNLYEKLITVEMPKAIKEREDFIKNIQNKFSPIFEMIEESDPDFVTSVRERLLGESENIKNILEQLKGKENGGHY